MDIVVDAVVVRPVGLAVTIVGTALFIATLPVTAPSKSVKQAADALVGAPARKTFARPMGDIDALND